MLVNIIFGKVALILLQVNFVRVVKMFRYLTIIHLRLSNCSAIIIEPGAINCFSLINRNNRNKKTFNTSISLQNLHYENDRYPEPLFNCLAFEQMCQSSRNEKLLENNLLKLFSVQKPW